MNTMAIIGSGLIGSSWAAFFLSRNCRVQLFDQNASVRASAVERVLQMHRTLADHGLTQRGNTNAEALDLTVASTIPEAVTEADWIQESVSETYEAKQTAFAEIDRHAMPGAVVASSSSGLLISKLQAVMQHPERALIAHPFNPPHLVPLVELVPGKQTSMDVVARVSRQLEQWGKAPVLLKKETPGHIANRLQAAVWREAIQLVLDGVASVQDVDRALSAGPGVRWALLGPNTIFHLAGGEGGIASFIDHIGAGWEALWSDMADWKRLPPDAKATLQADLESSGLDAKQLTAWRDEKLIQVLQALGGDGGS